MTYVVTDKCVLCRYTDCVDACPVDAFHLGENMLVINPDNCIDCTLCEPACPIDAIVSDDADHPLLDEMIEFAEEVIGEHDWPIIAKSIEPLPDADREADREDKWDLKSQYPDRT